MEKHGPGINGLFLDFLKKVLNMVAICARGPKQAPLACICCFFSIPFVHIVYRVPPRGSQIGKIISIIITKPEFFCLSTYNNDWFSNEIQYSTNYL